MRFPLLVCIVFLNHCFLLSQDCNILDFGAVPDGITINSSRIQAAIDATYEKGGGRVVVPPGRFLTGSIVLKSNVELHLLRDAYLVGSTDPKHYLKLNRWKALVLADHQSNISITGHGEINGQGRPLALHIDSLFYAGEIDSADYNFVDKRPSHFIRPQLIEFVNCTKIKVRNVTLRDAACWVQTYDQCTDVTLDSLYINSDAYWNNDGIDIQDCRDVRITNCFVNSADDGICLKSQSASHSCENIYIAHCTVRSSASAIKFGTVSHGGFKNVHIEHIKVYDTFRSALAIECVDGGILENIYIGFIEAVNTGNAIFIRLGNRSKTKAPGVLKNVKIANMKVDVAFERPDYAYDIRGPEVPFFHNTFPSSITGIPGYRVENVLLENIEINYPGRGNNGLANMPISRLDEVLENESAYPEFSMFGELPAWGFYVRHMDGLMMKNITLRITAPDYRPALVFDDVRHLSIQSMVIQGDGKPELIILHNTANVDIDNWQCVLNK